MSADDICWFKPQKQRDTSLVETQARAVFWVASPSWYPSCHTPDTDVLIDR
jgi:hypothetical protein